MRKPIISRTIPVTCIRAKLVSTKTGETYDDDFVIARHFNDPRKLERYFRDFIETKETHVCYIISTEQAVKMYAMSENDFVQAATEITGRSAAETKILFYSKRNETR